jgi:hypothetical protein
LSPLPAGLSHESMLSSICGQPPRLRDVGSLLTVCLPLGGLVEDPEARPRRKTVLALEGDRYAHGRAQLAVGHHGDELVQ